MRAEPKMVTAGWMILSTTSKPSRNSCAMSAMSCSRSSVFSSAERIRLSSIRSREAQVQHSDDQPLMRLDAVVLLHLGVVAQLPAAPQLRGREEQDDDQDRVR